MRPWVSLVQGGTEGMGAMGHRHLPKQEGDTVVQSQISDNTEDIDAYF